jgi:excisionase family DNA binding protein
MGDAADRLTYSVAEAARVLGISRSYCYELVQGGQLPSLRLGRRRLIPRAALERFVEAPAASQPATHAAPTSRSDEPDGDPR